VVGLIMKTMTMMMTMII